MIDSYFFYAVVWSLACTVDYAGRDKFNLFLRELLKEIQCLVGEPTHGWGKK